MKPENPEAWYANAFNHIPDIGPARLFHIKQIFGSFKAAWEASTHDFTRLGFEANIVEAIAEQKRTFNLEHRFQEITLQDIKILLEEDEGYPPVLRHMAEPPQILYIKGTLPEPTRPFLAIVGTRHPTSYGLEVCRSITEDLTRAGIVIVSGMAIGIDTCAHKTCLENNGNTIAVVGSGISEYAIYPSSNRRLFHTITEQAGAVLSEYPPLMRAQQWTFPARNRIIAALTRGTLVVEAKQKSGALITARHAVEFGRDVFAVPGEVFRDQSVGPHNLIREGAMLVRNAKDILEELGLLQETEKLEGVSNVSDEESIIL